MFRTKLFWSDYFEMQERKKAPEPNRTASVLKYAGLVLLGLVASVLLFLLLLRWVPVPGSAFMLWHRFEGRPVKYHWVPMEKISPELPIAVVASEDQRFLDHWGFDFEAIQKAIEDNRDRERPRGASTLSQQVAKNLFLWSGGGWLRKGLEACLTVAIELCWPKRRILEVYLNIAQFGPDSFGVGAAGRHYFGLAADRLGGYQAALMAAVLPNPRTHRLWPPSPYVEQRAEEIRAEVRRLGGPGYLDPMDGGNR